MTNEKFDECMLRIRSGDMDGLRVIYEEYEPYIFRIAMSYTGIRDDAEDIVSDFFVNLWRKADRYKAGGGHKAWLTAVVRNLALDHLRKNERQIPSEEFFEEPEKAGSVPSAEDEAVSSISFKEMVSSLPLIRQQIVAMKIAGEMTFKEISAVLGMPVGTVTWHYRESMKRLKEATA